MTHFEKSINALFPTLQLVATPWEALWIARERKSIIAGTRVATLICAGFFLLLLYAIELPFGLPPERYIPFRWGLACFSLLIAASTFLPPVQHGRLYRAPVFVAGL